MRGKVRELREENARKGLQFKIEIASGKANIGGKWYKWKEGKWKECEEERREMDFDDNKVKKRDIDENKIQRRLQRHREERTRRD